VPSTPAPAISLDFFPMILDDDFKVFNILQYC
jgi:hypothetical protein